MTYETLDYQVEDGILTLTLNRPDRMNAFNGAMRRELIAAFDAADADDAVRVIIVTGAGKAFCAGADLEKGGDTFNRHKRQSEPEGDELRDGGGTVSLRIFECTKPVIGAFNGAAVGVGVTMTLPMDIRMASTKARFGFVFARRGITMEACSSWFLPRIVGLSQALEWCYTGDILKADEALAGGFVKAVLPADKLLEEAYRIAGRIAQHSPVAIALTRQMMYRNAAQPHPIEAHRVHGPARNLEGDLIRAVAILLDEHHPARVPYERLGKRAVVQIAPLLQPGQVLVEMARRVEGLHDERADVELLLEHGAAVQIAADLGAEVTATSSAGSSQRIARSPLADLRVGDTPGITGSLAQMVLFSAASLHAIYHLWRHTALGDGALRRITPRALHPPGTTGPPAAPSRKGLPGDIRPFG